MSGRIPGIVQFWSNPTGYWHAKVSDGHRVVATVNSTVSEKDCRDTANVLVRALQLYAQSDEGHDYYSDNCLNPAMGETI